MKSTIRWILMAACLFGGNSIQAQVPRPAKVSVAAQTNAPDTSYLNGMPSPERLLAEIRGTNQLDTAARQRGAMYQMQQIIHLMMGNTRVFRNEGTPEEGRLYEAYGAASRGVSVPEFDEQGRPLAQPGSPQAAEWFRLTSHYNLDDEYRIELLQKFFSEAWRSNYAPIKASADAERAKSDAKHESEVADAKSQKRLDLLSSGTVSLLAAARQLVVLVILAYPLFAIWGLWHSTVPSLTATPGPNLQVPDSLRNVQLFKKQYQLAVTHGLIEQKEGWTETRNWTTSSGGDTYSSGGATYMTPIVRKNHSSSTVYHRYWLRSPTGEQNWVKFADDSFPAIPGQMISFVTKKDVVWMAYNHTTKSFVPFSSCWENEHRQRTAKFIRILVLMSGIYCIFAPALFGPWLILLFIWWAVKSWVNRRITRKRNEQFTQNYFPALRSYIEQCSLRLTGSSMSSAAAPPHVGSSV